MEEKYFCKYCGDSNAVLMFLTSGVCSKSPNRKHQIYHGTKRGRQGGTEFKNYEISKYKWSRYYGKNRHYFCKYCGHPHVTIAEITRLSCTKSPTGYHQPYEGEDKPIYICK